MSGLSSSNFAGNEMCLSGRASWDAGTSKWSVVSGKGFSVDGTDGNCTITISTVDKYSALSSCVASCDELQGIASFGAATITDGRLVSFTVKTQDNTASDTTLAAKAFSFVAILQE